MIPIKFQGELESVLWYNYNTLINSAGSTLSNINKLFFPNACHSSSKVNHSFGTNCYINNMFSKRFWAHKTHVCIMIIITKSELWEYRYMWCTRFGFNIQNEPVTVTIDYIQNTEALGALLSLMYLDQDGNIVCDRSIYAAIRRKVTQPSILAAYIRRWD